MGISFPPVATGEQRDFTIDVMDKLDLTHIRFAENWNRRGMAPDFTPLRRRIDDLRAAGLSILLTVQSDAPDAACARRNAHSCLITADAPLEAYLTALVAAVGNDIDAIQFGNEWDNQFVGSTQEFLALHTRFADTIRREAPDLTIVLGGITGRAAYAHAYCQNAQSFTLPGIDLTEIKQGFCVTDADRNARTIAEVTYVLQNADYDVADIHLYDADGLWQSAVAWFAGLTVGRPVWVTEFGGPSPELEPDDPYYQAARLAAYLAAIRQLPIARAYYFKLIDDNGSYHSRSGLFDRRGREKPAFSVFEDALSEW
ncbi:hypothetical protein [Yoonia sp. BS5-3]|uniref:Asl1-like glycosyl hydrolase catalytic domain-containing protein n=1 Tax=Yoonia phaeophyticola TaxID=3137369 RepID=A0ABZ2V6B5_9RHOB